VQLHLHVLLVQQEHAARAGRGKDEMSQAFSSNSIKSLLFMKRCIGCYSKLYFSFILYAGAGSAHSFSNSYCKCLIKVEGFYPAFSCRI
jgi:hypothetical protein